MLCAFEAMLAVEKLFIAFFLFPVIPRRAIAWSIHHGFLNYIHALFEQLY